MARTRPDYNFVTSTATRADAQKFGRRDYVYFHYFNPNGSVAMFNEQYSFLLHELVEPGVVPSGWLLAYNSDHSINTLNRIAMSKAFPNRIAVDVAVSTTDRNREKLIKLMLEVLEEGPAK